MHVGFAYISPNARSCIYGWMVERGIGWALTLWLGDEQTGYDILAPHDVQEPVLPLPLVHQVGQRFVAHKWRPKRGAHHLLRPIVRPVD